MRTQYALAMFAVNAARVAGAAKPNMATGTAEEDVLDYVVPAADIRRLRLSLEHLDAEASEADREIDAMGWMEQYLTEHKALIIRLWDHDGRRFFQSHVHTNVQCSQLLVHDFTGRGGTRETVAQAIAAHIAETIATTLKGR